MMKKILFVFLVISFLCNAQDAKNFFGGEYKFNPDNVPCLTNENRAEIKQQLQQSITSLTQMGILSDARTKSFQSFIWPVRKSSNSDFFDTWGISNYVDHNSNFPDQLQDYNCGTRSYDTDSGYNHQGLDIYNWPFTWYQFENDLSEVIAAAGGTIIYKNDGNFDKNCSFNNSQWNAVYIRHNDGSVAWYGHLKSGSLTNKNVGSTVVTGEYLGVIGSSGNSTGPHLHFEVYDSTNNLIDPYNGACNNTTSWWQEQKDYYDPYINTLLTHDDAPGFNGCPNLEDVNIKGEFLPNQRVYLASYFRDQLSGTTATYRLYRPNGSLFDQWTRDFTNTYTSSYWYWWFETISDLGTWRFEVSYQGQTESITFAVVSTLNVEDEVLNAMNVSPNPANNKITISTASITNYEFSVYNSIGQAVISKRQLAKEIELDFLASGLYYLKVTSKENGATKTFSVLKN